MTKQQLTQDGFNKLKQELIKLNAKAGELVDRLEEVAQPDERLHRICRLEKVDDYNRL